jgi:hypothetical protein
MWIATSSRMRAHRNLWRRRLPDWLCHQFRLLPGSLHSITQHYICLIVLFRDTSYNSFNHSFIHSVCSTYGSQDNSNLLEGSLSVKKSVMSTGIAVIGLVLAALSMIVSKPVFAQSISERSEMNFGTVLLSSTGATQIVLNTNGEVSGVNVTPIGSSASAARFRLTGTSRASLSITLSPLADLSTSRGDTLTLTSLTHNLGDTPTLNRGGRRSIHVGGTLTTGSNPTGGTYTGTYMLTVNYE